LISFFSLWPLDLPSSEVISGRSLKYLAGFGDSLRGKFGRQRELAAFAQAFGAAGTYVANQNCRGSRGSHAEGGSALLNSVQGKQAAHLPTSDCFGRGKGEISSQRQSSWSR
jgi:hypothetical protein